MLRHLFDVGGGHLSLKPVVTGGRRLIPFRAVKGTSGDDRCGVDGANVAGSGHAADGVEAVQDNELVTGRKTLTRMGPPPKVTATCETFHYNPGCCAATTTNREGATCFRSWR
ncbi:hypothetical protein Vqi01_41440 [Micromonospora qiuiae]|uniref:Uncharacterized protein n=1 Tax=Micromonospora qiuiae TaxID=502268 RepID=A0ABQ4JFG4_9ACTN|nr:hypothetical protein Vqi01_41440 [Micromonospora qiuiae]